MLGAEEEKESNVTLRKERESLINNVIAYFHEIIRIHIDVETSTYHQRRQPKRDVGGWMEKRHRIEWTKSVLSQFGMLCPGGQARVKPRPVPPPQGPGGRCRGTDGRGPSSSDA